MSFIAGETESIFYSEHAAGACSTQVRERYGHDTEIHARV